jgi:hypothetical protein
MKYTLSFLMFIFSASNVFAQKETFDLTTFTTPKAWKRLPGEGTMRFTKEDPANGTYGLITLYKSVPGTADAKENFDLAWTSLVKEMVTVSTAPEMQPKETEAGWETLSGYAPFENEGNKGVVILVTSSSYGKMVNLVILTNTEVYEKDITAFVESITLKKPIVTNVESVNSATSTVKSQQVKTDGFAFSTTNFDDGWTSNVQNDWVQVNKGDIKVLIHYPDKNADTYNSVLLDGLKNAWNVLVAPKYSSASGMEFKQASGWEPVEFAEAGMVEKATGKKVYVVLFKKNFSGGGGKYIEFITPDKKTFEQEFGSYENAAANSGTGWDKMVQMANYNKFAVAASDLKGKWTSDFTGMTQYVNAYTGASAGANTHASNESF